MIADGKDGWKPTVRAAVALGRDAFCFALGELEYDDPFTALVSFDGAASQPWARTDVDREINALCPRGTTSPAGKVPVAVSNEGDVYFLETPTEQEKIPNAGILSEDAAGRGAILDLSLVGGELIACGEKAQVYRRTGEDRWVEFGMEAIPAESGFEPPSVGKVVGFAADDLYAVAVMHPLEVALDPKRLEALSNNDDWNAWLTPPAEDGAASARNAEGRLLHWNGTSWRVLETSSTSILNDIKVVSSTEICAVGVDGVILRGNALSGIRKVSFAGDTEDLLSVTTFGKDLVVASDYALHRFDGHLLTPLRPLIDAKVNRGTPTPLKVQAIDDVLWYFDFKHGVVRYDGEMWEPFLIPSELLEREFKGLGLGKR